MIAAIAEFLATRPETQITHTRGGRQSLAPVVFWFVFKGGIIKDYEGRGMQQVIMQWFDEDENRLIPTFIKPQHFHPMVEEGVVFANSCGIWNEEGQEKYTPTLIRKNCKGGFQKLHGDKTHHIPLQHKLDIINFTIMVKFASIPLEPPKTIWKVEIPRN